MVRAARLNPLGLDWQRFFVAVDEDGEVVACVQEKPHRRVRELASLVVARDRRGEGIGREMVAYLQDQTTPPLWLVCRSTHVSFYQQCGFEEVNERGEMPFYFRLLRIVFDLGRRWRPSRAYLAVMLWRG
jgi:N-acetylglutamate synthase-like GNAT family acetyltransferase